MHKVLALYFQLYNRKFRFKCNGITLLFHSVQLQLTHLVLLCNKLSIPCWY